MRLAAELEIEYAVNLMIDGENGEERGGAGRTAGGTGEGPPAEPAGLLTLWDGRHMLATSPCLARTASAASFSAASSSASRSVSTTRFTPSAPISASTPR